MNYGINYYFYYLGLAKRALKPKAVRRREQIEALRSLTADRLRQHVRKQLATIAKSKFSVMPRYEQPWEYRFTGFPGNMCFANPAYLNRSQLEEAAILILNNKISIERI